jgi:glutamate N-acetyltransferase/amino-acid N-acetyltransferase
LIVNAGNANAFTGATGKLHVKQTCQSVAENLGCTTEEVFIASTGVIGEYLPIAKIIDSTEGLVAAMESHHWLAASRAIMTTDTFAKVATRQTSIGSVPVTINGFAKGSGMIEPDMATMLAFVFTDADIQANVLQQLLVDANNDSFNAITVDSDTSTSDTCLLFATGTAGNECPTSISDASLDGFRDNLRTVMHDLALQVVRDGEGASKLIEISVTGAISDSAARKVAKTIANSPLVKTAIAGEDANWGRVVMAVGKSAEKIDLSRLKISFGGVCITNEGEQAEGYDESMVAAHLKDKEIFLQVDLGVGLGTSKVWTCDLTHEYISINADYRS